MNKEFNNMNFTGERFVPEVHGNIELEHLHRYRLAMQIASGKMVLDIASGEGFGSAMLARVAAGVTGVDISQEAISHSQAKYAAKNLNFIVGSCSNIPLNDSSFDVVVSFETIEHHLEHEEMMKEIKRVLRPGGVLVISSPDKLEYSDRPNFSNPHHVKELYRNEFEKILNTNFKNMSIYGQKVIYGSAIFCEDRRTSIESYELADTDLTSIPGVARAVYLVAIASDGDLPMLSSGILEQPVNDSEVLHTWHQSVLDRDLLNTKINQRVDDLNEIIRQNKIELDEVYEQLTSLEKSNEKISNSHRELDSKLNTILDSRSWRITYSLRIIATFIRRNLPFLRNILSFLRKFIKGGVILIEERSLSDAAAMAIARTGRSPSKDYLAAIAPLGLEMPSKSHRLKTPKFSIIILQFNQSQLTINCLNSILRNTSLEELEIIVVDNGSKQSEIDALASYRDFVNVLEVGVNRYYGEGNNIGVEFSKGEFTILMNNDIAVTEGWLENISIELVDGIGAVGPCFIYPDNVVQEAGGYIKSDGNAEQRYKRQDAKVLPNASFECDYVSGALLLMRKCDYIRIGGFDLCWEPAYYEDVDLCLKLRLLGLKTICCPAVKIYHVENATSSDKSLNLGLDSIVEVNKSKFVDRWGAYLSSNVVQSDVISLKSDYQSFSKAENDGNFIIENNNKPTALIYTPFSMTPGGGERYILSIAAALVEMYDVTLAFDKPYSNLRILQMSGYFGLNLHGLKCTTLDKALIETPNWDLVFVLGNSLYPPFPAPSAKSYYICQFPFDHKELKNKNLPLMDDYIYICYSEFVSSFISKKLKFNPAKGINVLNPPVKMYTGSKEKMKKIISVGRFFTGGHCKNQHIIISEFKKMYDEHPNMLNGWELVLTGSTRPEPEHRKYLSECQSQARGYPIRILPDASSEVLEKELTDASVYWHAAGIGVDGNQNPERMEHFGITPLEAASAGCLVLVHRSGGPGELASLFPECIFSYNTVENLQQITFNFIENTLENNSYLRESVKIVARNYSYEKFQSNLFKLF